MSNPVAFLHATDATSFSAVVTRSATLSNVAGNLGIVVAHSDSSTDVITLGADTQGNTWVALTRIKYAICNSGVVLRQLEGRL